MYEDAAWDRGAVLHGLSQLDEGCSQYYRANIQPIMDHIRWMILFPDKDNAANHAQWTKIAEQLARIAGHHLDHHHHHRGRSPCSDRDREVIRQIWSAIAVRCPFPDVIPPPPPTGTDHPHAQHKRRRSHRH